MCGIVGVIGPKPKTLSFPQISLFTEALVCDSVRGMDGTGVFNIDADGNSNYLKLATHPFNLISSDDFGRWKTETYQHAQAVVGHNRRSTEGAHTNNNTHPFVFGSVVLVHNGHIQNYRSLVSQKDRNKFNIDVDSQAITLLFAREGPEKIIPELHGAFTFVWYDALEKKLCFVRNTERPLDFAKLEDGTAMFSSEGRMLQWLIARNGLKSKLFSSLKPGTIIKAHLCAETLRWDKQEVKLWEPKIIVPTAPVPATDTKETRVSKHSLGAAFIAAKKKGTPVIEEIPEPERFDIEYGSDEFVKDISNRKYPQIVWDVENFVEVAHETNSDRKVFKLEGKALNSEKIDVICNMTCTRTELDEYITAPYLIAFIRRVKDLITSEGPFQEVMVVHPRAVSIMQQGKFSLTVEHHDYLFNNSNCACGHKLKLMNPDDFVLMKDKSDTLIPVCTWCKNADLDAQTNPNSPLAPGE